MTQDVPSIRLPAISEATSVLVDAGFADALLAAMAQMAALSLRRQADVTVAMRRAGLSAPAAMIVSTLDQLLDDGCVEPPLALSDGGILVSLTMRGIEHLASTAHRHAVAGLLSGSLG